MLKTVSASSWMVEACTVYSPGWALRRRKVTEYTPSWDAMTVASNTVVPENFTTTLTDSFGSVVPLMVTCSPAE